MNIHEIIGQLDSQPINIQFIEQLELLYGVEINVCVKKILSVRPKGEFLVSTGILRLLSHNEILDASQDMDVDFLELKLIPILDTGDNDYITFDLENNCWCKFNIADSVKYKQRQTLIEYFQK